MIREKRPTIYHPAHYGSRQTCSLVRESFARYRASLPEERRILLDRYQFQDFALKVVGIGSIGNFCAVVLLMASDKEPLFLQVKQARASVLEPYAGRSAYANHGQRVVAGLRIMQAASDIFLDWTRDGRSRHFYVRQLRDAKMKPDLETLPRSALLPSLHRSAASA